VPEINDHAVSRREFLAHTAAAAAVAALTPAALSAQGPKSRVVHVTSAAAMVDGEPQADAVQSALARGLAELTGEQEIHDALRRFVSPADVVGIKLNALGGPAMCNTECVIQHLVEGLEAAGVPRGNIVIWDRFASHLIRTGWEIVTDPGDVRVLGTEGRDPDTAFGLDESAFFECDPPDRNGSRSSRFSRIVTELCTKIINVPLLKDHAVAGATGALKNIGYGVVDNTARTHLPYHCDPFAADIVGHEAVRGKFVLHVMDGLRAQYEGGPQGRPQFQWDHGGLLLSTDPVAMDGQALKLIESRRAQEGLPSLWETDRPPKHITTCAERNLGLLDDSQIDLVAVEL
jgi:uncharacterized protein (DUF362 family)